MFGARHDLSYTFSWKSNEICGESLLPFTTSVQRLRDPKSLFQIIAVASLMRFVNILCTYCTNYSLKLPLIAEWYTQCSKALSENIFWLSQCFSSTPLHLSPWCKPITRFSVMKNMSHYHFTTDFNFKSKNCLTFGKKKLCGISSFAGDTSWVLCNSRSSSFYYYRIRHCRVKFHAVFTRTGCNKQPQSDVGSTLNEPPSNHKRTTIRVVGSQNWVIF